MKERIRAILDQRMSKDIGLPKIPKVPKKNPEAVKKRREHRSGIDPEDALSKFDGAIVKQAIIDLKSEDNELVENAARYLFVNDDPNNTNSFTHLCRRNNAGPGEISKMIWNQLDPELHKKIREILKKDPL